MENDRPSHGFVAGDGEVTGLGDYSCIYSACSIASISSGCSKLQIPAKISMNWNLLAGIACV